MTLTTPASTPSTRFSLRPYRRADSHAVVQVLNAAAGQTIGARRALVDRVGEVALLGYVPNKGQQVVVVDKKDQVVGYAYFLDEEDRVVFEFWGSVHPHYWGNGVGSMLIAWAEANASARSAKAPEGIKTVLQTSLFEREKTAIALFSKAGYTNVRQWVHLVVDLDEPPAAPEIPTGLTLRTMDLENDWELVSPAMDESYTDHWGWFELPAGEGTSGDAPETTSETSEEEGEIDPSYLNSPGFCFLMLDGGTVVGGILCNAKLVERDDTGRVGSMFVRPAYRRRGIARTLMLAAFGAFWRHGLRRIITDTDADSFSQAPKLYASLGMRPYRYEYTFEKEIRPGREIRRLS